MLTIIWKIFQAIKPEDIQWDYGFPAFDILPFISSDCRRSCESKLNISGKICTGCPTEGWETAFKNVKKTTWSVKRMTEIFFSLEINIPYLLFKFENYEKIFWHGYRITL
jgi:hypothetical protein